MIAMESVSKRQAEALKQSIITMEIPYVVW